MYAQEPQPVTCQPMTCQSMTGGGQVVYESPSGVTVRNMTAADCDFAGSLVVAGFEEKFIHNVGIHNLETAREASREDHRLSPHRYHRIFIAEYLGERAGLIELHFHKDKKMAESDTWRTLSCWPLCRLACMAVAMIENVQRGRCYVAHICVEDRFQGKGVGTTLLAVADQQARANGSHTIYLWVASTNRARNLYNRVGYQKTGYTTSCCMSGCITGERKFDKMEKRL